MLKVFLRHDPHDLVTVGLTDVPAKCVSMTGICSRTPMASDRVELRPDRQ